MPRITIVFGVLIALIAPASMLAAGHFSKTALIPAYFGIALLVCGLIALKPTLRMHAMHAAALIGLIGLGGGLARAIPASIKLANGETVLPIALASQWTLALLCLVFLVLTIRSFIAARRWRKSNQPQAI